jgi:signal transduction histidine kinase
VKFAAGKKRLAFILDVDDLLPSTVQCDEVRLKQVPVNILDKAIKFSQKGEVELRVICIDRTEDGRQNIRFSVRDT